jgi:hypothetical protein
VPITNNSELYAAVEALREKLRQAGEFERSVALDDALHISSVAGEVLGEIKLQLRELQYSSVAVQLNIDEQIDDALEYLNRIL